MAGANATDRKCELAMKNVLDAAALGVIVNIGFTEIFKRTPFVAVVVTEAAEALRGSGTRRGQVEVAIVSDADKVSPDGAPVNHHERVGNVTDAVYADDFVSRVNDINIGAVDEFTLHRLTELSSRAGVEDRRFITRLTLECIFSGSRIT